MTSAKHVPFDLRERQEEMLVGEQRVLPPACFFDGAVDYPLRGVGNLARCDVEIFYVHAASSVSLSDGARRRPAPDGR